MDIPSLPNTSPTCIEPPKHDPKIDGFKLGFRQADYKLSSQNNDVNLLTKALQERKEDARQMIKIRKMQKHYGLSI
jgi:hypothetical protein